MAEFHRYPLRVQQSKLDGWWFIFVDEVPGLGVFGPNYEDLLDRLKVVASALVHIKINSANDGTKTAIAFCVQPITEPSSS